MLSAFVLYGLWMFLYAPIPSFSYFQGDFFCSFNKITLIITPSVHNGWRNCLDLVAQMRWKKNDISKQIDIIKEDSDYNKSAKIKLIKQRSEIDTLLNQTIQGITDLENKLFVNYKKRYFSKIKPIRSKLIAKQAVLTADLVASIRDGERQLVVKISKTIGFNYQRIKLIEGVLTSKSLDEMIPLLTTYEWIIANQISWKSE